MNKKAEINFTKSQDVGIDKIIEFMKKPVTSDINTRVFLLCGKAGTGKTTIIKHALKGLLKEDVENIDVNNTGLDMFSIPNVFGVAMSHKAKNVLSGSIHTCKTYCSYFGLKMKYNADGSIKFEQDKWNGGETPACQLPAKVAVHDECSMYDKGMLDMVLNETYSTTKIIFMGDPGQLPPINSDGVDLDSPVFYLGLEESNKHTLEERVRQTDGNPIVELSDVIYEQIFGNQDLGVVIDAIKNANINNGIGYDVLQYQNFLSDYKDSSENYVDTKVIAYKNAQVNVFNNAIRNHIHNKPDFKFIKNEIIFMNDSYYHFTNGVKGIKPKWICYNSDEYLITDISHEVVNDVECYMLYIDKKGHKHLAGKTNPHVRVVAEAGEKAYDGIAFWRSKKAKEAYGKEASKKWAYYYEFVNQFAKVSYGYCFTGYKAQGSTYKNIYVDVNDILTTKPITNKRKLQALYTAVTRASHKVTFLKSN